jgi:predicted PurR-regulated permease PerM
MNLEKTSFIGALALVTFAFFALLFNFMQPIFWGAILAVIFYPAYIRIQKALSQRSTVAALLTVLLICVTVIIPFWFIASSVLTEATDLYARVQSGEIEVGRLLDWIRSKVPGVTDFLARMGITPNEIETNLSAAAVKGSQLIGNLAIATGQNIARFFLMFLLMVYMLFFFVRDGDKLLEILIVALPLGDDRERAIFRKFAEVSRATVKGTLVIGLIQGALGGLIFWILGIEAAVFWGVVMVLLSMVPIVGASLVWAPAALIMAANGEYTSAGVLLAFGVLVIGLIENLLRPVLVGRDTRMPDYMVLLSTLGGLMVFGPSGFVIGPIIAAIFMVMWVMFALEHSSEDLAPEEQADEV